MAPKAFGFAVALTFASSSLASSFHSHSNFDHHHHRRQSVPTTLPGNWTFQGCYSDNVGDRTLNGASSTDGTGMTIEECITFCSASNWVLAGVEFGSQCYCDDFIQNNATLNPTSACNMPCVGNAEEVCGGPNLLNVFNSGQTPPAPPTIVPKVGNWTSLGCYSDGVNGQRTLTVELDLTSNTVESCTSGCFSAGYQFSGMEFSDQCFCDTAISNGGAPIPAADCNMVCSGNGSEFCGGPNALNMYNYTGNNLPPISTGGGGATGPPVVFPVTSGLPAHWEYIACYVDNVNGRIFEFDGEDVTNNTIQSCIELCISQNFTVAGAEFSTQCFCGDRLVNGAVVENISACNMGCAGNTTEACGGPNALSVYSSSSNVTALPVPTVQLHPGQNWTYAGCYTDNNVEGVRTLPWELQLTLNNSAETCTSQCSAFGYTAAGMEFGIQCFCGDIENIAANGGTLAPETDCATQCSGNPIEICGDGNRLTMYTWNGTMNVWHTPANTGYYEFFVPGVVVPLIATLGINNKVTFLEKWGTSEFENSTGAYELDLTLVDDFDLAWRTMHVETDVFCSGSVVLPDIGGRIINVGGWSLTSTFGIRLYQPDGSAGVNGTNDWEENANELHLLSGRWYPGSLVLSNGSILVMGGESGSNAPPVPSLEILPLPAGVTETVFLDFLNRTDPYNLYPFLTMLPSGRIFTAYYNEARILDPDTFDTVLTLPNMPGAVNNFLAGRTYPLEGSMIPLPQHAPYTDPLTVLICGGSTPGPAQVLDNCVSISPEVENATWTLERMPSVRVMTCLVPLPDGTIMIMNGAMEGVAGFGLASAPNFNAVLYDPTQPIGQRFSILNNTIVPRLYHSEAILLPDGRILVSGSDPQTPGFPEEMRIEVYIPPYLNQGITPPVFNISNTDFGYGQQFTITNVKVFHGTVANIKVSLIAAVSSTHGNSMGARTIFPAFTISGTTVTITTPPNSFVSPPGWWQLFVLDNAGTPSHSAWIRIGGDPAQLGAWPNLPGFTTPGL